MEHLFYLARSYEVLILLLCTCEQVEALLSFLMTSRVIFVVPFLSNHVLAERHVNAVAREELWVSTLQVFVLIFI